MLLFALESGKLKCLANFPMWVIEIRFTQLLTRGAFLRRDQDVGAAQHAPGQGFASPTEEKFSPLCR